MLGSAAWLASAVALTAAGMTYAEERSSPALPACPAGATVSVTLVSSGRSLALADGCEVRLAGIEVSAANFAAALAAKKALAALVERKDVVPRPTGPASDGFGRPHAYIFAGDGSQTSVQYAPVAGGHIWVPARVGDKDFAACLLAAERTARTAKLGLWRDPYYEIRGANDPAGVTADRGRFALVEGEVVPVRESGGTIGVNLRTVVVGRFHRHHSETPWTDVRGCGDRVQDVGRAPDQGARLHREKRGGPWIEAMAPKQIEIVAGN
jgi:endonuclease YncB( thermonuclease family)